METTESNRRSLALAALLLLGALLAGCAEDATPQAAAPTPTATSGADQTVGGGASAIEGVVLDDEEKPVAGVEVVLLELESNATTDEAGAYRFTELAAGVYTLTFAHPDFKGAGRNVDVGHADTIELDVILFPVVFDTPYADTLIFEGYIFLGTALSDIDHGCQDTGGNCRFDFTSERGLETVVSDVEFTPSIANPTGPTRLYFQLRHADFEPLYADGYYEAPHGTHAVFGDWAREEGVPFYQNTVCDLVFVCYDQRFTNYATLFYFEPAPEGWSVFPEGA